MSTIQHLHRFFSSHSSRTSLRPGALLCALLCALVLSLNVSASAHAKKTLRVAHDLWIGYAGFFVAQAKGFFTEEGIDLQTTQFSGPADTMPPLLAGHVDIALTTLYNLTLLAGKDQAAVKAIYLLDTSKGADAIVAAPGIDSPAQLKGKKVAVTTGEVNHMLLIAALKSAGLKESDITLVNMNADDAGAAFLAGRVDAAVTWEPWVSRATSANGKVIFSSADTPDLILDSVTVTQSTLAERKAALIAFLRAIDKGTAYLNAHPEESMALIGKALDASPEDVAGMLAGDKIYGVADNRKLLARNGPGFDSLANVAAFLQSQSLLDKPINPNELMTADLLPE